MRFLSTFSITLWISILSHAAAADEPTVPMDLDRLVLDTARTAHPKPDAETLTLTLHGEVQLRGQLQNSYPLDVTSTTIANHPNAIADSLGQNAFATSWLRVTPRLQYRDKLAVTAQLDVLSGLALGDATHDVSADQYPRDNGGNFATYLALRWLYLDWRTPIGLFRVGQQPNHWAMGILANDGDHPYVFGDYRGGAQVERILFATKPSGADSPFTIAIAGDLVYRDWQARLTRGDVAWQGVLAGYYEKGYNQLGVFTIVRSQSTSQQSGSSLFPYSDTLSAGIADIAGKFATPVPGHPSTFLYGAAELATVFGSTNELRSADQAANGAETTIRSYGGAALLGIVHETRCDHCSMTQSPTARPTSTVTWGDIVAQVEVGYASGDSNPNDQTEHRFTFDPNHKVGLLLFDEVMRWQTARAATAASDPTLAARPSPGANLLPSNGGVFGAQYVYPTVIVRPLPFVDLKLGSVLAQTTADLVDPYRVATQGAYVNYRGGDSRRHDLGIEFDGGFEVRAHLDRDVTLQLGAQAGVLFPGGAFADAAGLTMRAPWIAVARAGLQY